MYTLTRAQVAELLKISTRSVDRYIKSGKLRAKKEGKIVYVNKNDVQNIQGGNTQKPHIIINSQRTQTPNPTQTRTVAQPRQDTEALSTIYKDMRNEIRQKDALIQGLSIKLGRSEEIAKNSVSLIDFKRSQFLLEESKEHLAEESQGLKQKTKDLEKELKYEKSSNKLLMIFVIALLIIAAYIWYTKI